MDLVEGLHVGVTKAPTGAVLSLAVVLASVALLTIGWRLAVHKRFVAHRAVQTAAVAMDAAVALIWMVPSLLRNVLPEIPARLGQAPYASAVVHAVLGAIAAVLGIYVVLAASRLLPARLSFTRFRPVMRSSYALYLIAALAGVVLYVIAYVGI